MNKKSNRSFWALMTTQFFGAFNDNVFQIVVALLVIRWMAPQTAQRLVAFSGIVFAVPFLMFSLAAGRLADRWSKRNIIVLSKTVDLMIVALAVSGIYLKSVLLIMTGLFLLALQSTFFGPCKYGILPELRSEEELSSANGFLSAATVIAILLGNITGTFIINSIHLIAAVTTLVAVGSFISAFLIEKTKPMNPTQTLEWNPFPDFFRNWRLIKQDRTLEYSLLGVSIFWFVGGVLHLNTLVYVKQVMSLSDRVSGILLTAIVMGVALGSTLAGKLSKGKVELGLVPVGAIGMSLLTIDLYFSHLSLARTLVDAFSIGFFSGFYLIPLNTLVQLKSPDSERGRVLATANFLSFVAIALAGGFLWACNSLLHANPAQVFLILGILSLILTGAILWYLPQDFIRLGLYAMTNFVYRIHALGKEDVPLNGPALLVSNGGAMMDPFLISGALPRPIRFMMSRIFYERNGYRHFSEFFEIIQVSDDDSPDKLTRGLQLVRKNLEDGHAVCIFSEETISIRDGILSDHQGWVQTMTQGLDVPIIPVHVDEVKNTVITIDGSAPKWTWPKKFLDPVRLTFAKPIKFL